MTNYLIDTNVFFEVFKQNSAVKEFIESRVSSLNTTVFIECLQGSKADREKIVIKKYLSHFPIFYHTPNISKQTIALIDKYSNSYGLLLPDALIAATCLEYDLMLVTYNVKDFQFIEDLKCLEPNV